MAMIFWQHKYPMNFSFKKREIQRVEQYLKMIAFSVNAAFGLKFYSEFLEAYANTEPEGGLLNKTWNLHADEVPVAIHMRSTLVTVLNCEAQGIDCSEERAHLHFWKDAAHRAGRLPIDLSIWPAFAELNDENMPDEIDKYLLGGPAFHHSGLYKD